METRLVAMPRVRGGVLWSVFANSRPTPDPTRPPITSKTWRANEVAASVFGEPSNWPEARIADMVENIAMMANLLDADFTHRKADRWTADSHHKAAKTGLRTSTGFPAHNRVQTQASQPTIACKHRLPSPQSFYLGLDGVGKRVILCGGQDPNGARYHRLALRRHRLALVAGKRVRVPALAVSNQRGGSGQRLGGGEGLRVWRVISSHSPKSTQNK